MPAVTQRRPVADRRTMDRTYRSYQNYAPTTSSAARVYDYPVYTPRRVAPQPVRRRPEVETVPKQRSEGRAHRKQKAEVIRLFWCVAGVFALCFLMLYRYSMILESNDQIAKLNAQCAEIVMTNQAMQTKIDRALELGSLEKYATEQLGMVHLDGAQVFYINMQMEDQTETKVEEKETTHALQGTPGALVHAIQVLK